MAERRNEDSPSGSAARPYDATTKQLLEADPAAWLAYVGLPTTDPAVLVDADLSTVLAAADKVVRVEGSAPRLVHVELQSGYDPTLPARMLQYGVLLHRRHRLPVASVVVLLRRQADGPALSGRLDLAWQGEPYLTFAYRVVRAWALPVEAVLAGGLGTLPLAPLADVAQAQLPTLLRRMDDRFRAEAAPREVNDLWTATYVLAALRYREEVLRMIESLRRAMRDSWAYQEIVEEGRVEGLAEGRAEGARLTLLRIGTRRLGQPNPEAVAALEAIRDVERIERMAERVLDAATWAEVLATE
jgi:predicted transposase YdaD